MKEDLIKKIKDENIKVHRKEAFIYDTSHSEIFNRYEQKRVMKDIEFIAKQINREDSLVLDIGCGTGNLSLKFLNFGFSVTALDISKEMLNLLNKKYALYKKYNKTKSNFLKIVEGDIDAFISSYDGQKYDVIAFSSVLHHLPDYVETINNVGNMLRNRGIIYIVHEPTKFTSNQSTFWKVFGKVDRRLFRLIMLFRNIRLPSIDYTYSDYHKKVDLSKITDKYTTLQYEEYNTNSFAISSFIEDKLNNSKELFKIIMEKKYNYRTASEKR